MKQLFVSILWVISLSVVKCNPTIHAGEIFSNGGMTSFDFVANNITTTVCSSSSAYRTADASCNNLEHPHYGATHHSQIRLLPNAYMDGISIPRVMGENNNLLPSARTVSVGCFPDNSENATFLDRTVTQFSMQWGQYIDHDVVATPLMTASGCCGDDSCVQPDSYVKSKKCTSGPCFPIKIPQGDRHFTNCMGFIRSTIVKVNNVYDQITGMSSFVDASVVYGLNQEHQNQLRTHTGGKLKVSENNTLPLQGGFKCRKEIIGTTSCPHAGDKRVSVFPGLTATHLLFVREHNKLADELAKKNSKWDDERIFQEARKIIIAFHQKITYEDFLPHVIGDLAMNFFKLNAGNYQYDPKINPGMINEFAVAAFRYGHSQINAILQTDTKDQPISNIFFQPWVAEQSETAYKTIFAGQCSRQAQKVDKFMTRQLTDKLFLNVDGAGHSTDLAARNVQRGRDHGIRPYLDYLDLALNQFIRPANKSFQTYELPGCLDENVYKSVNDVDLFVGGLNEKPMDGALVGPTFAYIIGEQFRRLKHGDRLFFESSGVQGFTPAQLTQIRKMSLARLMCRNSEITTIQKNVFAIADSVNTQVNCQAYNDFDLTAWTET